METQFNTSILYHLESSVHQNYNLDYKSGVYLKDCFDADTLDFIYRLYDFNIDDETHVKMLEDYFNSPKNTYYLKDYYIQDGKIFRTQYKPFAWEFETTGKLIVENDLRNYFKKAAFDINTTFGIVKTMKKYAKQGMLHGFVGNTCPTLLINRTTGEIIIGTDYDDILDEEIIPEGFEILTSVCTDLWWYSIVDYDFLKNKIGEEVDEYNVVNVTPGKYRLEHYYEISSEKYHQTPYARIVKID